MSEQELSTLKEWDMILRNISDFVRVGKEDGITFIVKTNENSGHHRPHLHVETSSASLSIAIDDGEILASSGKISPAQLRQAQQWIRTNRTLIEGKWNEFSNGIKIAV